MYLLCSFCTSVSFNGAHSWYFDFNNYVSVTSCCWYYAESIYINRKSKLLTVSKTSFNTFIRVLQEIKRISTRLITVAFITLIVLFAVRDISSGTKQFRFSGIRLVIKHTMQHVRHVNCYSCAQHNTPNTKQFRFKCSNCSQWYATSSYIANQSYCLT